MKKLILYLFLIIALGFSTSHIFGQENYAINIKTEISGSEKMLITYDIDTKDGAKFFNVIILLTHNAEQIKVNSAYGDYGSKISPGTEKAIVWYFNNDFKGDISKVEVDIYAYKENEPQAIFRLQLIGNNGYSPCEVIFSNKSTYANEYKWDFGDPSSGIRNHSFDKEPKHTFDKGGLYHITLVAGNTDLGLESTFYYSLEVLEHPPTIAEFEYHTSDIEAPFAVSFTENCTNADSYSWSFGDPGSGRKNTSSATSPKHKYKQAGTYTVNLTVTNSNYGLSHSITKELVFKEPELPAANFIFTLSAEIAPSIAVFKNTSTNSDAYTWDFGNIASGNNNASAQANPSHTYSKAGKYEVKLIAINSQTGKSTYFSQMVEIAEPPKPPVAGFAIENNDVIAPATIIFSNTSIYADRYSWNFGDSGSGNNNTSNKAEPTHTYTSPGRYKVTLTSFSSAADKSDAISEFVIITEPAKPPVAGFFIDGNNQTAPARVNFRNSSSYAERFAWDFGDPESGSENSSSLTSPTHTYSSSGRYKVRLISTNTDSGKTNTHTEYVIVNEPIKPPVAHFTVVPGELIAPAVVSFTNSSSNADSYSWEFGDPGSGNRNISSLKDPTHTYSEGGRYELVLICSNTKSDETSTYTYYVTVKEPAILPIPDFAISAGEAIAPVAVSFINESNKADSYTWSFGDPESGNQNSSTEVNPFHTFEKDGRYQVVLSALNQSSGEVRKITKYITINKPIPPPIADFTFSISGEVAPVDVSFSNASSDGDQYNWSFGDLASGNNESTEANPSHRFTNPGSYTISLTLTNSKTGKTDVISKEIRVVSEYITFVQINGEEYKDEIATSIIQHGSDEFLVLVNEAQAGSSLIKINEEGVIVSEKKLGAQIFDIGKSFDQEAYVLAGFQEPDKLMIQNMSLDFDIGEPVLIEEVNGLNRDFSTPRIAVSDNAEVGIIGNIVEAGDPKDFWFQKLDIEGRLVPVKGKTFKFIGIKLENEIIASEDGGFAITGYWQEDASKPKRLMFATVDSSGKGYLKAITAVTNFIGCDIVKSHTSGYGILSAQGSALDESLYDVVLMIVGLDGGPISFSGSLHGDLFLEDLQKFPPCIIRTEGGYVVASYAHNGTDYDINLIWIDVSGEMQMKQEVIKRPGDQLVTDILQLADGGFIIIGAERIENQFDALILRTDPFGRVNPNN